MSKREFIIVAGHLATTVTLSNQTNIYYYVLKSHLNYTFKQGCAIAGHRGPVD